MTGIIVRVTPLATPAIAGVQWDEDSFTLSCEIRYAPDIQPAPPPTLSDQLDEQFGIPPDAPRVITAGTLTLTLDRAGRLCSLDFYTNVDHWQKVDTLPPIPVSPHTPSFGAAFDALGRASAQEPAVGYDRASQCIYLIWRDDASVGYAIAPNLSVAATPDGRLARIELAGVSPF
ncbi:hypothetical protein [Burkholderia ubonensis]|uniref:Uncharacterized protein n=1 Tax=Burkholderia ubonensis TaxID=101571 RepID=A0A119C4T2_9BURK|nr:hypothetical protein [Burkholderia ubonensis]KVW48250.1 hypothetical protein WK95_00700 [Burkholderia ubonensis]OMG69853.1 hypothetical protein BW685_30515 [Burkholderia ubonensis]